MKTLKFFMLVASIALLVSSCTTVDSGHTGVKVTYGGETDMNQVYPEGMYTGISWMWNSMIEYETREQTIRVNDTYLDRDGLKVPIDAVVYFRLQNGSVNRLHKDIGPDWKNRKVLPTVDAALKNVIPQYRALELNTTFREEADRKLADYLKVKFPEFYTDFVNINITKVDIPEQISKSIIDKQVQDEKNALAEKKKLEEENLAAARIAKADGDLEVAKREEKTRTLLSQAKLLDLYKAETDRIWAQKGVSPYGNNNVFGDGAMILKNK